MDTANGIGIQTSTQRVIHGKVSRCVEADSGLVRPTQFVTVIDVDGIGFGEVGDNNSLEGVNLK